MPPKADAERFLEFIEEGARIALEFDGLSDDDRRTIEKGIEQLRPAFEELAASFELITLQAAGHFMHCERPDAFAHLVLEFIQ
jgi:pimeloyl-ACP methyl ester carboxylesterase